jgi:hypothetical protein
MSFNINQLTEKERLVLAAQAVEMLKQRQLSYCVDPADVTSRPHAGQQELLDNLSKYRQHFVVSANRVGKSAILGKLISSTLDNDFSLFERPAFWPEGKLQILLVVKTLQSGEAVFKPLLEGFLKGKEYKIQGHPYMTSLTMENGNSLYIISTDNPRKAYERIFGRTVQLAVLDEMPSSLGILEETALRSALNGVLVAGFTPKVISPKIKNLIENCKEPNSKKYKWSYDLNPLFARDPVALEAHLAWANQFSPSTRNAILHGDWTSAENAVYSFDYDCMVKPLPENYSPLWKHFCGVDPASASYCGYTLVAENPESGFRHVVAADVLTSTSPRDLVQTIERRLRLVNCVLRIYDSANPWFSQTAMEEGFTYLKPLKKNNRREDMIASVQNALGSTLFLSDELGDLVDEFYSYQYSETDPGKIINPHKFHRLDALRYLIDSLPAFSGPSQPLARDWTARLRDNWKEMEQLEAKARNAKNPQQRRTLVKKLKSFRNRRYN